MADEDKKPKSPEEGGDNKPESPEGEENKSPEGEDGGDNKSVDHEAKNTELKKELDEAKEKLVKIEEKGVNFGKLKEQGEEKTKKHDKEKETLQEQIDKLKGDIATKDSNQVDDWYKTTVAALVGSEEKDVESVKTEYDILNMPTTTREEVQARTLKAMKLAGFELQGDVTHTSFGSGREPEVKEVRYSETEEGKASYDALFPDLAEAEKAANLDKK